MQIVAEGSFKIRKGGLEEHRSEMAAFIRSTRAEAGCIDFSLSYDVLDETIIRVLERWESRDALNAHLQKPHVQTWLPTLQKIMESDLDVRIYEAAPEAYR